MGEGLYQKPKLCCNDRDMQTDTRYLQRWKPSSNV